ncbi:hypothetical protein GCM10010394_48650 [Streptomyces crystallinus]|uniref:Uncharacterized protein n=1 Tax=Streptomyces crystallinus TaxID=68191 RepID=A0ABN1GJR1_9ACTN
MLTDKPRRRQGEKASATRRLESGGCAGHETTVNTTANGWWTLFRHPQQLAPLRAEPTLLPGAVEELLRYDTPLQLFERWVLDDIEVGGTVIPRGSEVALLPRPGAGTKGDRGGRRPAVSPGKTDDVRTAYLEGRSITTKFCDLRCRTPNGPSAVRGWLARSPGGTALVLFASTH